MSPTATTPAAMVCRRCTSTVPAGEFCGQCGACRIRRAGDGPDWLRMRYYCAAPGEDLRRPGMVSTLLPLLPRRLRPVFRLEFALLLLVLGAVVAARWQVAASAVAVFGFPVILADYLYMSGFLRNRPRWPWITAALTGVVLGAGWALTTGILVAGTYGIGLGAAVAGGPKAASLGIPLGAVLVMAVPAVIVRLFLPRARDPLQGLTIGMVGATSVGLTATLVRLGPQLATGLVARARPLDGLVVEAAIRGIVIPLTSAAFGGIAGLALWFTRHRTGGTRRRPILVAALLTVAGVAGGTGLAEAADLGPARQLLVHLVLTIVVLTVLRILVHLALLHRAGDGLPAGPTVVCAECGHTGEALAFCPQCGVAEGNPSVLGPVLGPPARPGQEDPRLASWVSLAGFGAGLAVAVAVMTVVSVVITEPVPRYACPPDCGGPPTGQAVHANPRFTAADGKFSVDYPPPEFGYQVTTRSDGVVAVLTTGDGGVLRLFGEPARGRSAPQVVHEIVHRERPAATRVYEIPNALVGYQPGYGEVDDDYPVNATGTYLRLRVITIAAVDDDYALIASGVGPFHQFGPDFGPGPPSAVNLQLALNMDTYVSSFTWGH